MIYHYGSLSALIADARKLGKGHYRSDRATDPWYGNRGLSFDKACDLALTGDDSLVSEATALLAKLETSIDTMAHAWLPSPVGAYPIVPEALAGMPDPMRRRALVESELAPITVHLPTNATADLSPNQVMTRGLAVLALVMKLQSVRPVKLVVTGELSIDAGGHGSYGSTDEFISVDINTQPLDLATACFVITQVGFFRRVMMGLACGKFGYYGRWPKNFGKNGADWHARVREYFAMDTHDIYIPRATGFDFERGAFSDPVAWVNSQVAKACNSEAL